MRRQLSLIALFTAIVLAGYVSPALFRSAQANSTSVSALAQSSSDAAKRVAAIVELESVPVAVRQRARMPIGLRDHDIDFETPDALAYENQVAAEQADFAAGARVVSPGLRVRTHLRKLA